MTAPDLAAIKARVAAATPGPWRTDPGFRADVQTADGSLEIATAYEGINHGLPSPPEAEQLANAALIAHAPSDIAALVAEVERVRSERDAAREAAVEDGWRDIASAPRDGTPIDLWIGHRVPDAYWGRPEHSCGEAGQYCDDHPNHDDWCDEFSYLIGEDGERASPTHWRPRPSAPASLTPAPSRDDAVRAAALEEAGSAVEAATRAFYSHAGGFSESLDAAIRAGLATAIRALKGESHG